jgi:predicted metal-binding membrane protein
MTGLTLTGRRAGAATAALAATLGLAALAWVVALRQMDGMDMGYATELGPATSFAGAWIAMMAAMMLPGAAPATLRRARSQGRVAVFVAAYLAVWAAMGIAVYVVYAPHSALAAGAVTVAAGLYELTPLKRRSRERCRQDIGSGLALGVHCVGASIGLMAVFVALGVMSAAWMAVVAVLVAAQKLLPPRASIDVPLALAIVVLGLIVAI